jgi:murein DD-endopeptidase MepM/ murein hydrolase activator NlpD
MRMMISRNYLKLFWYSSFFFSLLLAACQPPVQANYPPDVIEEENQTESALLLEPVSRDLPIEAAAAPPLEPPTFFIMPEEHNLDVLRFTFPTPGPEPISLWRPPLYEAPWALGPHDHFYFSRPIAADVVNWPLADYRYGGMFLDTDIVHTGIDIPNPRGTPVLAAAAGKVVWAGYGLFTGNNNPNDPYGMAITIQHDFGYESQRLYTIYAHLDRIDVVRGQRVETGEAIGIVGNTGNTTGPHLHFEVRLQRNSFYATRNPELWLAPPHGWGVLVGRMMNTNGSLLMRQELNVRSRATGQKWTVISYGLVTVNSDDYYQENLVLSDLPAGDYIIQTDFGGESIEAVVTIRPGAITYFTFRGKEGFDPQAAPPGSAVEWAPNLLPQP